MHGFRSFYLKFQTSTISQIPNFHNIWWLSIVAAIMSFAYSFIGLGLSIAKIAVRGEVRTTVTGLTVGVDLSGSEKVWRTFQAPGDIAFAYSYSNVPIEIQDTLKSEPPENQVMKKASFIGVSTTTIFYLLCGVLGYAALGTKHRAISSPALASMTHSGSLTLDTSNAFIAIRLIGAYQSYKLQNREFFDVGLNTIHILTPFIGVYSFNYFRLIWRIAYVIVTAVTAIIFRFFNNFLGLIGAHTFWPLTVYLPVEMYIAQAKIPKFSTMWVWLKVLSMVCLVVSIAAACGSVQGLVHSLNDYKPFRGA